MQDIYNEGGRKFVFLNLFPLNCLPLLRRLVNGTSIDACLEEEATALARLHNSAFPKSLQKLEKKLNGFRYSVTDSYTALLELMEYPSKYGMLLCYIYGNFLIFQQLHHLYYDCAFYGLFFIFLVRFQRGQCGLLWRRSLQRRLQLWREKGDRRI